MDIVLSSRDDSDIAICSDKNLTGLVYTDDVV